MPLPQFAVTVSVRGTIYVNAASEAEAAELAESEVFEDCDGVFEVDSVVVEDAELTEE